MAIAQSIRSFLTRERVPYTLVVHRAAYTAQQEAQVAHIQGRHWAKIVVCIADGQPIQAVLPSHLRVDLERLRDLARTQSVRLASEAEMLGMYPECELGAMPPFGPIYSQRVFVDVSLVGDPEIVFNAGTHTDAVCMHYNDFAEVVKPTVGTFARPFQHGGEHAVHHH
jgi:Ala-tRNA(Pro) deacylase